MKKQKKTTKDKNIDHLTEQEINAEDVKGGKLNVTLKSALKLNINSDTDKPGSWVKNFKPKS